MATKKQATGRAIERTDNPVRCHVMCPDGVRGINRAVTAAPRVRRGQAAAPARILVVDDDLDGLEWTSRALEQEGYEVFVAADGKGAIKLAGRVFAHLIILNITMPEASGLEVISTLRPRHPELRFVAVGGPGEPACNVNAAKKFGADSVLIKPFDARNLLDSVREALGGPAPSP